MKKTLCVLSLAFGCAASSHATVTMGFNDAFDSANPTYGIVSNLANAAGVVTNGMQWGIIVDTGGDGFSNGAHYGAYAAGVTTAGFLSSNGAATNDYYIPGTTTVDATTSGYKEGNGTIPGNGSILDDLTVNLGSVGATSISAGQSFALVWFATNTSGAGSSYGIVTDASFVLPADGASSVEFGAPFGGNDATRPASFIIAPEPSRLLLLAFGMVGLVMRRRRKAE